MVDIQESIKERDLDSTWMALTGFGSGSICKMENAYLLFVALAQLKTHKNNLILVEHVA